MLELLVVISLIVVLSAMMLPAFSRSMRQASKAVCAHNMREIGIALTAYRMGNRGWLPTGPIRSGDWPSSPEDVWLVKLLDGYLDEPMVMTCPDDPYRYRMSKVMDDLDNPVVPHYTSYGLNGFILRAGGGRIADLDRNPPKFAGQTILMADMGPDQGGPPPHQLRGAGSLPEMEGPFRQNGMLLLDDGYDVYSDYGPEPWLSPRHGDCINIMTVDGGVVSPNIKKLLGKPIDRHYKECEAGGCTLCRELSIPHYSFAEAGLYWWTGSLPPK